MPNDIFLSYSRKDNVPVPDTFPHGWVTAIRDHIFADHRRFSTEPLHIFLDTEEIRDMDDWRLRILGALRSSKILLVCLSPTYFASPHCRWEWDEYIQRQVHKLMGSESIATVYFVEVPGSDERNNARWLADITRGNFTDIRPWFPEGAKALQREEVRERMAKLGESLWERLERARRAEAAPGNLRRQNPHFVGRREELRKLHEQLATGAVGVVTAVHGLGGQGKTELAVAYAHAWADCYPAGLWALGAEGKKELIPLIGELAWDASLGFTPTDAQKNDPVLLGRAVLDHLRKRAEAVKDRDPDKGAAALLLLDNVSEPALLSHEQLATLPQADWLRIVATTRLPVTPLKDSLVTLAVDALDEASALSLLRDHQPPRDPRGDIVADLAAGVPDFANEAEEEAAREIVRALGGFTLAVEQVAVFLGLHPDIAPSTFLSGLHAKGLPVADALPARYPDVSAQMLTQSKQLSLILEATLNRLALPARTAMQFAALLPHDTVPWPWLRSLTLACHPEMAEVGELGLDPWLEIRRRLTGLRLLTPGDHPEVARIHRLVAAHLAGGDNASAMMASVRAHLAARAWSIYNTQAAPQDWELDALLIALPLSLTAAIKKIESNELPLSDLRDLANATIFLCDKVVTYRRLPDAAALLAGTHAVIERLAASDPSNADWQRGLSVSNIKIADVLLAQGDLSGALAAYRQSHEILERLAASDPRNAGWQRDLWVSYYGMANVLERMGDSNAMNWWRRAYEVLSNMKARGLFISPSDGQVLHQLRAMVGG